MVTATQLYQSTIRFAPWRRNYTSSTNRVLQNIIPYKGTKSLLFHYKHRGLTQAKNIHNVYILFTGVDFLDKLPDKAYSKDYIEIKYDDEIVYARKPHLNKNNIFIRCSCYDFYFRGSYEAWLHKYLYGPKPKKYIRKTKNYPPVNPKHIPMMCKHIYNSIQLLQTSHLVY